MGDYKCYQIQIGAVTGLWNHNYKNGGTNTCERLDVSFFQKSWPTSRCGKKLKYDKLIGRPSKLKGKVRNAEYFVPWVPKLCMEYEVFNLYEWIHKSCQDLNYNSLLGYSIALNASLNLSFKNKMVETINVKVCMFVQESQHTPRWGRKLKFLKTCTDGPPKEKEKIRNPKNLPRQIPNGRW